MNGPELLEHAAGVVARRRREYGAPVNLFEHVAHRWPLTLGTKVSPAHVVLCLIDLKLARRVGNLPRLAAMAREQAKREQWRSCRTIHELRTRLRRLQARPIRSSAEPGGGSRRYGILVVAGHPRDLGLRCSSGRDRLVAERRRTPQSDAEAVIRTARGARLTHRRKRGDLLHPAERCLVWELS